MEDVKRLWFYMPATALLTVALDCIADLSSRHNIPNNSSIGGDTAISVVARAFGKRQIVMKHACSPAPAC